MLRWPVIFLVLTLIAWFFGFAGISTASAGLAKVLFYVFFGLYMGAVALEAISRKHVSNPPS